MRKHISAILILVAIIITTGFFAKENSISAAGNCSCYNSSAEDEHSCNVRSSFWDNGSACIGTQAYGKEDYGCTWGTPQDIGPLGYCKPSCSDGIYNQNEYPIADIGGVCSTCSDGYQNQDETGVDAGGACTEKNCIWPDRYDSVNKICSSTKIPTGKLSIRTNTPTNVTQTTATLNGKGGSSIEPTTELNSKALLKGYFRYSTAEISPIFCNDIYGTNMVSTKDIILNDNSDITKEKNAKNKNTNYYNGIDNTTFNKTVYSNSFSQDITGLKPDTKYYYCAIISNRNDIAYGGVSIIKNFNTNPLETTIETKDATKITPTTATLNGSYSAVKNVKTYFEYQENILLNSIY